MTTLTIDGITADRKSTTVTLTLPEDYSMARLAKTLAGIGIRTFRIHGQMQTFATIPDSIR